MSFELFDKQAARSDGQATIAVQRKGIISLNRAAWGALGEPRAVQLLFDRELQRIGIRHVDVGSANSYPVRPSSNKASYLVSGAAFCKHYGIDTETSRRLLAGLQANVLVANLNGEPVS